MPDHTPAPVEQDAGGGLGIASLVARTQLGDPRACRQLLLLVAPRLEVYLDRVLGDHQLAQDALQETLVLIWRRIHQVRDTRAFWAWAFRIARRVGSRLGRRRAGERIERRLGPEAEIGHVPDAPDAEAIGRLMAGVDALPPLQREVIHLHYGEGFSLGATAAILQTPVGTIKSRLNAATVALRRATAQDEQDHVKEIRR